MVDREPECGHHDWKREFPDMRAEELPPIPPEWIDASWRNDACPSFVVADKGLIVYVDHEDGRMREAGPESPRYTLLAMLPDDAGWQLTSESREILSTSDWNAVLVAVQSFQDGDERITQTETNP